ncbi:MAG: serine/threonine-protein kinase, partial [Spirulinaceae cyanobacterium]
MTLQTLENRYQIIRPLGTGGFGDTFLAEDTYMPSGRRCVIKQLKPLSNNPQVYQLAKERFQREAVILEELGEGHTRIPRLYAYFENAGQFYLVQEYIEGATITAQVQNGGILSESSVREILLEILPVLDYVHSKRIIHRDIKPDNIILRSVDYSPVLIDFGAVKEAMGTMFTASGHSASSIVIGTPGYMPGEQSAGRPIYPSDIYSLGLTAIYSLTGKIPQELGTDPQTGTVFWHQYAPGVSSSFAEILDRAVHYHPRDRYYSTKDMLEVLQGGTGTKTLPPQERTEVSAPINFVS